MTDKTFDALENAASATECTGLMPALETDHAANEASAALQGVHSAKTQKKAEKKEAHAKKNGKTDRNPPDDCGGSDHRTDHRGHDSADERR